MNRYLILIAFFLLGLPINAQEEFYYYKGDKFYLQVDYSRMSIVSEGNFNSSNVSQLLDTLTFNLQNEERNYTRQNVIPINEISGINQKTEFFVAEIEFPKALPKAEYYTVIQKLSKENSIIKISPTFTVQGEKVGVSNNFYVKLFKEEDKDELWNLATRYSIDVVGYNEFMPLWFTLSCGKESSINAIEASNLFYEMGLFESTEPELLYHNLLASSDPKFSNQWGLKNTGQYGGSIAMDIKAESAWTISTGSNINVAIFDHGFERNHPDLVANNYGTGYDATTNTTPSQIRGSHGTACAGIVGAQQNNSIGISGVAPNSKLMSISINLISSDTPQQIANGFNWAWQNGADIISNSWGGYAPSSIIDNAIINTLSQGRNGKGTVVVFASGNEDNTVIRYPGNSNPDILVVGAISPCGERKSYGSCDGECWGSCYGTQLDIVAPGVLIPTTDRASTAGYNPNTAIHTIKCGTKIYSDYVEQDYTVWFNGTSAAAPHVAGVAALILSVNPNLTVQQVRNIIEGTAQKVRTDLYTYSVVSGRTNGSWNNQMGYGLIDACMAVSVANLGIEPLANTLITSNTTLSTDKFVSGDLVIETGATLTITSKIRFANNSRVIIKSGAKLIVDGGTLTNIGGCSDFWQGVEVWGTTSQHQFPEYNPTYQGRLELINGGTIENAHLAATNWKPDDYSKIGGVIFSNGGVFKNNRKDVAFIKYENFSPSNPSNKISDHSGFSNTDFTWDSDYLNLGLPVHPHVTLWNVHGVSFINCHFSNTRPKSLLEATASKAIYSIDASYTVGAGCSSTLSPCPSGNLLKSTFTGYSVAIEATGAGTSKAITVAQSNFTNNIVGITVDAFNNVSFNRNTISIGTGGYPIVLNGTGISIDNSTGYIVEENAITKTLPNTTTGIYVNNSGTANNRLYKNTLTGLTTGNNLTKINKNLILWGTHTGLQFLCNTYTNNNIAVRVGPSSDYAYGVKVEQGTASQSAGNVFNSNTNPINNISEWSFNYYHNGGATQPTGYSPTNKVTLYTATANSCPSSFGGLIFFGMKPGGALDSLENEQQNYKTAYDDLYYNYLSLIDDGNTEAFKAKVSNSWSEDVWKLRGNLLEKSPYLSQEVLLETAKLGTLPNAMLLEICLANPDVTKNVYFVNKLEEATNGSFPSYMYSYLLNNDKKTTRTQLEGEMTAIQAELSTTNHFIANITATADEYSYDNTYNTIIRAGNDLSDRINLMDFFIEHKQWSKADSVLQSIQMDKKMQENLLLIEDFDQYIAFRSNLGAREISQLNDNEIEFLQKLAEKEGRVSGYARNILCFFYNVCYDRNREDEAQKMMLQEPTMLASSPALETIMYSVNVYPNPAKEFVTLQWEILDELQNCHYKIVDLSGIIVSEGIISENKNEQTIDTRNLREGVYLISIYNNDEVRVSKKLVVQKQN